MAGFLQLILILFVITKHNYSIHDAPTAIRTIAVYRSAISISAAAVRATFN